MVMTDDMESGVGKQRLVSWPSLFHYCLQAKDTVSLLHLEYCVDTSYLNDVASQWVSFLSPKEV